MFSFGIELILKLIFYDFKFFFKYFILINGPVTLYFFLEEDALALIDGSFELVDDKGLIIYLFGEEFDFFCLYADLAFHFIFLLEKSDIVELYLSQLLLSLLILLLELFRQRYYLLVLACCSLV